MAGRKIKLALSGNPNAGKTTVFNAVTGARQHIANYPGVTVEKKFGTITRKGYEIEIVDLPGIYSLTAYSLEEIVARDFLINERPDVVVDIVDASNLDRNLYLAVQFLELGVPLIIALNMIDVASARGIMVDETALSRLLGVPVVPTVARSSRGLQDLLDTAVEVALRDEKWHPEVISYGRDMNQALIEVEEVIRRSRVYDDKYSPRWLALKCLEGDEQITQYMQQDLAVYPEIDVICKKVSKHIMDTLEEEPEGIIADHRYGHIAGITKKSIKRKIDTRLNLSDQIDKVLTNRILGPVIMLGILYGIYGFTFWATEEPLNWLGAFFTWISELLTLALPEGNLRSLLVSGIIDGVGGVLGFVPLIMFMFFAIAIMEDSGYMARVAYMLDRVLRWFGLHGNSVMALIISGGISGGCAVPGVLATRTLRDPKERIATLLVVPFMNCGAKLPLFGMLIAAFFVKHEARLLFLFTLLSWSFALFAAKIIRSTVLRGPKTPFVMELPPYRMPTLKGLLIHTWERTWEYVKKAGTVILGISIILWAMMTFPGLPEKDRRHFSDLRSQLTASFLSSPGVRDWVRGEEDIHLLDRLYLIPPSEREKGPTGVDPRAASPLLSLLDAAGVLERDGGRVETDKDSLFLAAGSYVLYRTERKRTDALERMAALRHTVAGRIGRGLEVITRPIGFDYRTNIALIGGFAAKEVIVSTLGTAYSLGEDPGQRGSLSKRLRNDPAWSPLKAFTLILFTMLYVPCFATFIMIKKESSWGWAGFSIIFNLVTAYTVSLALYRICLALGIGA